MGQLRDNKLTLALDDKVELVLLGVRMHGNQVGKPVIHTTSAPSPIRSRLRPPTTTTPPPATSVAPT